MKKKIFFLLSSFFWLSLHHGLCQTHYNPTWKSLDSQAVKEVFFTQRDDYVYAILPRWPGHHLTIRNLNTHGDVTLLANNQCCKWENKGDDLDIELPDYDPKLLIIMPGTSRLLLQRRSNKNTVLPNFYVLFNQITK